jgi:hypothetical protein
MRSARGLSLTAAAVAGTAALALPTAATAQLPVCDEWQEELQVVFPERIALGTPGEIVISRKDDATASTPVAALVVQIGADAPAEVAVPPAGSAARVPAAAASGDTVRMAVWWQQDTGDSLACAGAQAGVATVTPSRAALARYARRMRPALVAWGTEARPAMSHIERGQSLLRGVSEDDIVGVTRIAPQVGMAIGSAAPILRRAATAFAAQVRVITPPAGMAPQQRRLTREFARFARSVEVLGNVLGRVDSPLALLSAGFTIARINIATPGRIWARSMTANYEAARLAPPRWVANLAKD